MRWRSSGFQYVPGRSRSGNYWVIRGMGFGLINQPGESMFRLMDEQIALIRLVTSRLESESFPYMLTGSLAMAAYAEPRMTRDLDVVVECESGDAERLAQLFESDCYVDVQAVARAVSHHAMFNVIHRQWIAKVDFIVRKPDPYRTPEFQRRRQVEVDGFLVWVVSPEDLILSKLTWNEHSASAQQTGDVRLLLESVPQLDVEYLEQWSQKLGVYQDLARLRSK